MDFRHCLCKVFHEKRELNLRRWAAAMESFLLEDVIDTHIHLSEHYSGGLQNSWHPKEAGGFRRDWRLEDFRKSAGKGKFQVSRAIFVECFNEPALEEAKWVLGLMEREGAGTIAGVIAQICVQRGAEEVKSFLEQIAAAFGTVPKGLKGARYVFMAWENQADDACLDAKFLEGLAALQEAGLIWEFCCQPRMAPYLPACIAKFPRMTFVIDHLAHNGNLGGEMHVWGPAIDALSKLPNVYMKMGAMEQWDVSCPGDYMDRAIAAFGFDRILYESNWFVNEAVGEEYDKTALVLYDACKRAGASHADLRKVFHDNACKVFRGSTPQTFSAKCASRMVNERHRLILKVSL